MLRPERIVPALTPPRQTVPELLLYSAPLTRPAWLEPVPQRQKLLAAVKRELVS